MLSPLLVITLGLLGMEKVRTEADIGDGREVGNATDGRAVRVINGIEQTLARHQPEVVILGNSLSDTDIQPGLLAKRLGLRKAQVQRFNISNSIGTHWYLVLENRVYANGHRPKLVLLLSDLKSALAVTPRSEGSHVSLSLLMDGDDAVLEQKLGRQGHTLQRIRQNRGIVRERALTQARNVMVDLLFRQTVPSGQEARTEAALKRVFHASNVDMELHEHVIPTFDASDSLRSFDPLALPSPRDSFLDVAQGV